MALIRCSECGKEVSDKAISCPGCGCPLKGSTEPVPQQPLTRAAATGDAYPVSEIKKHLSYAKSLEETIYTLKQTRSRIERKIQSLGKRQEIEMKKLNTVVDFIQGGIGFAIIGFFVSLILLVIFSDTFWDNFWENLILIITIVLAFFSHDLMSIVGNAFLIGIGAGVLGFFIIMIVGISENRKFRRQYNEDVARQEQRVWNEKNIMIPSLEGELAVINEQIDKNSALLRKLYSLNIIYPKYRELIPVVTMYEWFESGRCSSLSGSHGAYDTFETESRQNQIIYKLDVAISMLNDIRNSQYMLYEAISQANETSRLIYEQSARIAETNGKIADNTELIAYNTDVIRRNTTISAYIDVFDRLS